MNVTLSPCLRPQGTAATALLVAGHHLFPLFCSEPAVLQAARGVLPIIAALCFWDGLTATMSGATPASYLLFSGLRGTCCFACAFC